MITVSRNHQKQGIEIRFSSKPETSILSDLKANGWKWSGFKKCWYKRESESAADYAKKLEGQFDKQSAIDSDMVYAQEEPEEKFWRDSATYAERHSDHGSDW